MPTINDVTVQKPSDEQTQTAQTWPIWECGVSKFDWEYTQTEKCLILEGKVEITGDPETAQSVTIGPGDYVTFPSGLKCFWDIKEPIRKHYDFE